MGDILPWLGIEPTEVQRALEGRLRLVATVGVEDFAGVGVNEHFWPLRLFGCGKEMLLNVFLLSGGVLARDSLASGPSLRGREYQISGFLDLLEHINSILLFLHRVMVDLDAVERRISLRVGRLHNFGFEGNRLVTASVVVIGTGSAVLTMLWRHHCRV